MTSTKVLIALAVVAAIVFIAVIVFVYSDTFASIRTDLAVKLASTTSTTTDTSTDSSSTGTTTDSSSGSLIDENADGTAAFVDTGLTDVDTGMITLGEEMSGGTTVATYDGYDRESGFCPCRRRSRFATSRATKKPSRMILPSSKTMTNRSPYSVSYASKPSRSSFIARQFDIDGRPCTIPTVTRTIYDIDDSTFVRPGQNRAVILETSV